MSEKFMNRLGLMNWYIITLFAKNEGVNEMFIAIRNILSQYMEKSKVAEYISVMVMELALNNENTNINKSSETSSLSTNSLTASKKNELLKTGKYYSHESQKLSN